MINYFIALDPPPDSDDDDDDDDYCFDCYGCPIPAIADLGNKNGLPERVTWVYTDEYLYNIYMILMRIPSRTPRQRANSRRYQILPGDPPSPY